MEADFFAPKNPFAAALEVSKAENPIRCDRDKIAKAIQAGKFSVVEIRMRYCPRTDATMGADEILVAIGDTVEDAREAADTIMPPGTDNEDHYLLIREPPRSPVAQAMGVTDDDIPF
jgi:hypothetical protein